MKRFIPIILTWLVLASTASADQFLATFEEVAWQARRDLNVDTAGNAYLTDTVAYQKIREGIALINPLLKGDKATTVHITSFHQNTYTLDTTFVGIISVEWAKGDTVKGLVFVPRERWYEMEHKSTKGKKEYLERPSYYDYTEDQLFVHPPPRIIGDTIKVLGWKRLSYMDTLSLLLGIPEAQRVVVLKYVIWQAGKAKGNPLTQIFRDDYLEARAAVNMVFNNRGRAVATSE